MKKEGPPEVGFFHMEKILPQAAAAPPDGAANWRGEHCRCVSNGSVSCFPATNSFPGPVSVRLKKLNAARRRRPAKSARVITTHGEETRPHAGRILHKTENFLNSKDLVGRSGEI
jgi:hypothetical protein